MKIAFLLSLCLTSFAAVYAYAADIESQIRADVTYLASDSMNGRQTGTAQNAEVQNWLINRLQAAHVTPAGKNGNYTYPFINHYLDSKFDFHGINLMGIIYPHNVVTKEAPTVMVGGHFDHVQMIAAADGVTRCWNRDDVPNNNKVCNGAADDAAAVAILLSYVDTLASEITHPVAIAFWDGEELGLLGSDAFLQNPSFDLSHVNAYLDMDIVGLNFFNGMQNDHFIIGGETGGATLQQAIQTAVTSQGTGYDYHQVSYAIGHARSDCTSFYRNHQHIPIVLFSDGDGAVYHTNGDKIENLNFAKVFSVQRVLKKLTIDVSNAPPQNMVYHEPTVILDPDSLGGKVLEFLGLDKLPFLQFMEMGIPFPSFADVTPILDCYKKLMSHSASDNKLTAQQIAQIQAQIQSLTSIQSKGSLLFTLDVMEKLDLLKAALTFETLSRDLSSTPRAQ